MAGLDLLAMPSRIEAFPMVIGEAMTSGAPCIATDVGDAARIIVQLSLPDCSSRQRTRARRGHDRSSWPRCPRQRESRSGMTAQERIADLYDIESVATRYADLWLDLAQN